jgi:hypothetical protein
VPRDSKRLLTPNVWSGCESQENLVALAVAILHQCVRPHMRALASSYSILTLRFLHCGAVESIDQGGAPITQVFPANLTSGGTESSPRSRIRELRCGLHPPGQRLESRTAIRR